MSVIIRLQNLPWSANALDIRQFFHGLGIPEGGVHIVGGELGDAFIAFSTDEDARQAFERNNGKIKEIQVKLMLSSRTEMQRVIEAARAQSYVAFLPAAPAPIPAAIPAAIPSAIPEIKKDDKDRHDSKRDRRRSRSKSRDRKDRSKDRDRKDRRHRDRSRSRSKERRERRRRDRSRSRSRDRREDRRGRDIKKPDDKQVFPKQDVSKMWSNQQPLSPETSNNGTNVQKTQMPFMSKHFEAISNLSSQLVPGIVSDTTGNGFPQNFNNFGTNRLGKDNWNKDNPNQHTNMLNRMDFLNNQRGIMNSPPNQTNFPKKDFNQQQRNNFSRQDYEEKDSEIDSCVKLVPFYGGYGDVRRFFQGLFISNRGIKFINDDQGHRTGIVYIQFGHTKGKTEALRKSGENLNGLQVEVTDLDEEEFKNAVDRYLPPMESNVLQRIDEDNRFRYRNITKFFNNKITKPGENDLKEFSCLIVDDLPSYVKEQDILHMFSNHPIFSLILTSKPRGGHIAYVKFSTQDGAKKAHEEKQHHVITGKPVFVRPCTDEEFELINKAHEVDINGGNIVDIGTDCVLISKLPMKTNDGDIADFFSDIGVIPVQIHLVTNHLGFTGQAYCEFESTEEASKAMKKNDTALGNALISVKPVSRKEMISVLGQPPDLSVPIQSNIMNHNRTIHMNQNDVGPRNMQIEINSRPPPHFNQNRPFFQRNFSGFGGSRGGPRFGPPRGGGGPRFRYNGPPQHHQNMDAVDDNSDGCTVYMDNVPYKAGTNEILEFFDGYNVTNNVSRRYNPNNTPSAEARVLFPSPEEAYRAVQEKNGDKIWDRPIFLKQT